MMTPNDNPNQITNTTAKYILNNNLEQTHSPQNERKSHKVSQA